MSEWHEQREIIQWFKEIWPEHAYSIRVSMNGLNLGGGRKAAIMVNQMRAQGMIDGEADIAILLPRRDFGSLLLEHKAEDSPHRLSESQEKYLDYHNNVGNCAVSSRGIDAAKAAIITYMESV